MIVVDTSVLIDFLRGATLPGAACLRRLELEGVPYLLPGICCQEVLQGARDQREWELLAETFSTQHLLSPRDPWETHRAAARIFYDCRRAGVTVRSSIDCLVAQLTLEQEGVLLHNDQDFEAIRRVCPLRTLLG